MPGYSNTPLWKKLGYKDGIEAWIDGAYPSYVMDLRLPTEVYVTWLKKKRRGMQFAHIFCDRREHIASELKRVRELLDGSGVVWVSWPKRASGISTEVTDNVVREVALPLGLVDIKVCAVNDVWSGLKLMIRKEQR